MLTRSDAISAASIRYYTICTALSVRILGIKMVTSIRENPGWPLKSVDDDNEETCGRACVCLCVLAREAVSKRGRNEMDI